MLSLALVLAIVEKRDSYALAGLVLAVHAIALAISAPVGGRLADRSPSRRVLAGYLCAHAAAYALMVWAITVNVAAPLLIIAASLLGLTTPPASPVTKALWARLVPPETLQAAYAVDNSINEVAFIAGPVLVSAMIVLMPPQLVIAAAGMGILVGLLILLSFPSVQASPAPASGAAPALKRLAGPLSHRPTLVLLLLTATGTFGFGCLRIATVAKAEALGSPQTAGLLIGLLSVGALVGTLAFGAFKAPSRRRALLVLLGALGGGMLLTISVAPGLFTVGVLIVVAGLLAGPSDTLHVTLLADSAPADSRAEVFSWLNTFMWLGYAAGTAVAGWVTAPGAAGTAAFIAAGAAAIVGAVMVATLLPALDRDFPSQRAEMAGQ
ncbi:MFS transporter [Micromonospora sp. PLK6-60]|nr:MFS transporter [Micromonospora sp. PLK6-60]